MCCRIPSVYQKDVTHRKESGAQAQHALLCSGGTCQHTDHLHVRRIVLWWRFLIASILKTLLQAYWTRKTIPYNQRRWMDAWSQHCMAATVSSEELISLHFIKKKKKRLNPECITYDLIYFLFSRKSEGLGYCCVLLVFACMRNSFYLYSKW